MSRGWAILCGAVLAAVVGCSPKGRMVAQDENRKVGYKAGGSEVYERQIDAAVGALLDMHSGQTRAQGKMTVAFIGVENKSAEELGDIKEAIYEIIDTQLVNRAIYTPVSKRYIDAAKREAGVRDPDELLLPPGRARFMSVLGQQGIIPDFLLWCKLTSMTTETSPDSKYRDYLMTMDMVNANTGETVAKKTAKVSKEYTD